MNSTRVLDLKAFVPANDFEKSRRFYADLGFSEQWHNDQVAEFEVGGFRFSDPSGVLWHIADTRVTA